jgi:hypothetical protein
MFNQSFHPQFSQSYIPEILGIGVVVILTMYWLKNKLDKTNLKDKKIKNKDNEKPDTETTAFTASVSYYLDTLL